ncbi:hypothetical protein [Corynebacterium sp.]|uniref:hypothetical protein n=1 Tax=Corynebacterium sp. TaxID=1720 RepID=UPI00054E01E6|nr:hypothetical protein [Corynebacterium sp.]
MKLKKSLLALTTAATVAVAGTTAAVAEETPNAGSAAPKTENGTGNGDKTEPSKELTDKEKQKKERQEKLANSSDKFFGWNDKTSGLDKMKSVVTLITTIGALVAGIVTLASNFGKIEKLFK